MGGTTLLEIDEKEFSYTWPIQPPYAGDSCEKLLYNIYVNYFGQVSPCIGLDLPLGNIHHNSIKNILHSREMQKFRLIMKNIHGKCSKCERSGKCYGCRGTTFALTGDPFASDPTCWRKV